VFRSNAELENIWVTSWKGCNKTDVQTIHREVLSDDKSYLQEFALQRKEKDEEELIAKKGLAPVGSLMFSEAVERRLDVFIFSIHCAQCVRGAPVGDRDVRLNGKKVCDIHDLHALCVLTFCTRGTKAQTRDWHQEIWSPLTQSPPGSPSVPMAHMTMSISMMNVRIQEKTQTQKHDSSADFTPLATPTETELVAKMSEQREAEQPEASEPEETKPPFTSAPNIELASFYLPLYASRWLLIPAYIEVSFASRLAIYVRHPTAQPG